MHADLNFITALVRPFLECVRTRSVYLFIYLSFIFRFPLFIVSRCACYRPARSSVSGKEITKSPMLYLAPRASVPMRERRVIVHSFASLIELLRRGKRTERRCGGRKHFKISPFYLKNPGSRFCGDARKNVNFIGRLNFHGRN